MALNNDINNVSEAFREMINILQSLTDDDSIEASIISCAAVENASTTFRQYFNTRNLCSGDARLPLEAVNANNEYVVVWLHPGGKLDDDIEDETIRNLQYVFNHIEKFDDIKQCIDFLRKLDSTTVRLFLITSCFYDGMVCYFNTIMISNDFSMIAFRL